MEDWFKTSARFLHVGPTKMYYDCETCSVQNGKKKIPTTLKNPPKQLRVLGYCRCKLFPKSGLGSEFCNVIFWYSH